MLSSAVHAAPRRTFAEHLFAPPPHPAPGPISWAHLSAAQKCGEDTHCASRPNTVSRPESHCSSISDGS